MDEFDPIVEATRGPGEGPVDTTNLAARGLLIVAFTAPSTPGSTVNCSVNAVPNTMTPEYAHGVSTKVAISKKKGNEGGFDGTTALNNQQGMVTGEGVKVPKGVLPLDPSGQYYFNVQYKDKVSRGQPEVRAQLSFM